MFELRALKTMTSLSEEKNEAILLSAVLLFIFSMGMSRIADYDIFFHLSIGKFIWETGSISNLQDPFSFTAIHPTSTTEWLADIIFYRVHAFFGLEGLVVLKAVVIAALFYVIYLNMTVTTADSRRARLLLFLVLIIAAYAMRMRMFVRPFIFEYLLLALFVYVLNLHRVKGRNLLFLLPLFQVLWVNIHPSNILGPMVAAIFVAGEGALYVLKHEAFDKERLKRLGFVFVAVMAASLINPSTYKVFTFPFSLTGMDLYMATNADWQPLRLSSLTGYAMRYTWGFSLLLILAAAGFLLQRRKASPTEVFLFLFFLLMVVKRLRFSAEFAIVIAPVVTSLWAAAWAKAASRAGWARRAAAPALVLLLAALFYTSILGSAIYSFGAGLKERVFPERAVDFLVEKGIRGNMFNSIGYGGYLAWRLYPELRVFIDGRNEVHGERIYRDYLDAHSKADVWKRVADEHSIDWVILEYGRDYSRAERIPHLADNPDWALIYWDTVAMVYARRSSLNDSVIEGSEYRYVKPNDMNPAYLSNHLHSREGAAAALGELERNLLINPANVEAHMARAFIYYSLGMKDEERAEIEMAIGVYPRFSIGHSALGAIMLEEGDLSGARSSFEEALRLDPYNGMALAGMERLEKSRGR